MTISYENIYNRFLQKVDDIEFLQLDRNIAYEKMKGWLHTALSVPYTRRLFSSLVKNDEILTFDFELKHPVDDDADVDFIEEALALGMLIAWLEPKVQTTTTITQGLFGKEQKLYSQSSHLGQTRELLETARSTQRRLIMDRGYINNTYLDES